VLRRELELDRGLEREQDRDRIFLPVEMELLIQEKPALIALKMWEHVFPSVGTGRSIPGKPATTVRKMWGLVVLLNVENDVTILINS